MTAITCRQGDSLYTIPAQRLILALGHSARDTFETLYESGLAMEPKPFAMGVRIEHRQSAVDAARYRQLAGHPALPPATYKLSCHLPNGRSAFSFCVCPGGQELGRKLRGYDDPAALLTGIETRSSSPVRLVRDDRYESNIRGVYPCGEGAGYAGGILSAAADGMRCAEKLLEVYR